MASTITILLLVTILVVIDVDTSGAKRFKYADSSVKDGRMVNLKIPGPDFPSSDQVAPDEKLTRLRRHLFGGIWRDARRQKETPYGLKPKRFTSIRQRPVGNGRTRKRLTHIRQKPVGNSKDKRFPWSHRWPGSDGKDNRFSLSRRWPGSDGKDKGFSWSHHWTSEDGNSRRRFFIHTNIFNGDRQSNKPTPETTSLKPDPEKQPERPAYQRWLQKPDGDREQDKPDHSNERHKPWSIFKPMRHRYHHQRPSHLWSSWLTRPTNQRPSHRWSSWWTRPTNTLSSFIQSLLNTFGGGAESVYESIKEFVYEYAPFIPLVYKNDKYTFVKPIGTPKPQRYVLYKLRICCIKYPSLCDEAMKNLTTSDQKEPEKPSEKPGQRPEIIGKPQRPTDKPMKIPEDPATTVPMIDADRTTTSLSTTVDDTMTTTTLGTTSNYPMTKTTLRTTTNYPMTKTTLVTTTNYPMTTTKLRTTSNYPMTTTTLGTTADTSNERRTTVGEPVPTEKEVFLPPDGSGEVGSELIIPPEVPAE